MGNNKKNKQQQREKNISVDAPVRVLHYIGSLNIGGSQSMIMSIYRNIDRKKVQFDFVIDRRGETFFKDEIESYGGRVYVLDDCFNGYNYFRYSKQWKQFFKNHPEYKILHCHVRSVASIVLRIAKNFGLKTICHSHNTSNGHGFKAIIKRELQKRIISNCDYYFACSKEAANWLYGETIANSDSCTILNNAVDIKDFDYNEDFRKEIRKKYSIKNDTYLVGHVGRFEKQKNHDFILKLIEGVSERDNITFMLCGDGSLKDEVQRTVKEYNLDDRVIFVPGTNEIYKYYSAFDYFIMPSLYEGLGIVLVEAQFSGLTCLVSPSIPLEARISNNFVVEQLVVVNWLERIKKKSKNEMRNSIRLFDNAKRYDVKRTAKDLQLFYVSFQGQNFVGGAA